MNPLLRQYPRVLENAPHMGYDDDFVTDGMRHFDVVSKACLNLQTREEWSVVCMIFILELYVTDSLPHAAVRKGYGIYMRMDGNFVTQPN